ncbi:uncharacterized protein [Triticum aestivum]|nr:uncharacterized protein LOC123053291 [Triticum aestivum]XP_044332683.1 uncharacterized protein LOC123053291 [Triticum aestivum]XP_044332684.1 uncharacterized protein LOC123053291 [Triticum aestivum]XP_044332685.1 uncharacterized protein LOC123053291 [Triticum aestivum]XP_044332686.1 uncharacterized protein LOC123053291 [Triticum aestivum]
MEGELRKETEMESSKGTEMESSKGTEYEKKLEILMKARHDVTRLLKKGKYPARHRALLHTQQHFLSEERNILRMMGKSRTEIHRYPDSDSGDEMGRASGSLVGMEPQLGISKRTEMDGELRKEQESIRKLRDQLTKTCESSTDPATQRIFLDQLDILWREEDTLLTMMSESGMDVQRASGSDTNIDSDSGSGDEMGSSGVHPSLIRMEWRLRKEMERNSSKGTEIESGKEQEMEGKLSKEHQRLRKVRSQLNKRCQSTKDPATQRILLTQQEIPLTKEQALLTIMRQSGMEIERDPYSDSGNEMGRDSPLISMEWGLSKGTERDTGDKEMGLRANGLVVALSSHLEVLRREISFLRTEVMSRGNGLAGNGNKADQEHIIMSNLSLDDTLLKKKVNLPYLGCETQDVMDFLLVETQQLLYRFNSFASIQQKFRIPISSDKIEKLRLISNALVGISELIKRHKSAAAKGHGDHLDRAGWDATWGCSTRKHGAFDDITTLSPMQFTACTPGIFPFSSVAGPTLQIYSVRLVNLNRNLSWPLDVYGVVAARDDFDHNLNILFRRSSANCQRIKKEDPFLHLIGPSRAIVAGEPVLFQIDLKLKYGAQFEHTASFTANQSYRSIKRCDTMQIRNSYCTAKIRLGRVAPAIQATIVGVRVVEGEWPFKYGCNVSCLFSPADATEGCAAEVVLLDCRAKKMRAASDGYLSLSRNVVAVGLQGTLRVITGAYSKSGERSWMSPRGGVNRRFKIITV